MRIFLFYLLLAVVTVSCSPSRKMTGQTAPDGNTAVKGEESQLDGSSVEKAIVITAKTETAGVKAEYDWLKKQYPGYTVISQGLNHIGKKSYDVIRFTTKEGVEKTVYFDISSFFGKW